MATKIVPSAWLDSAQVPGSSVFGWRAQGTATSVSSPELLHQDLWAPWCGGLTGFTGRQELDYTGSSQATAQQYLFTFASSADARTAYQAIVDDRSRCEATWKSGQTRQGLAADTVITRIASADGQSAWSWHWTGFDTPVSSAGPQIDHEYLVQVGSVLSIVEFDEHLDTYTATPAYDTASDATALRDITARLCSAYSC